MERNTRCGEYRVYHKREAGNPQIHRGGPWFFEPTGNYSCGDVYSPGYKTRLSALLSAQLHETIYREERESRECA